MSQRTNAPTLQPGATHRYEVPFDNFRALVEVERANATETNLRLGENAFDQFGAFSGQDVTKLVDGDVTTHLQADGPTVYPIIMLDGAPGTVTKAVVSWVEPFQPMQYVLETSNHFFFQPWLPVAAPSRTASGQHEVEFVSPIDGSKFWRVRTLSQGFSQLIDIRLIGNDDVVNVQRNIVFDLEVYEENGHVAVRNTRQDAIELQLIHD